jgi:putative solute:sodium symporter small subunit
MFVKPLNRIIIPVLDFPLGFYMAAQGSLIVFVVMLFMFAKQQNAIDREFGYAEED